MALWCIFFMRGFVLLFGGISTFFSWSMECLCIVPLTPVVMVIRGLVFHPLFCILLISGSYVVCLCARACYGNMSWQYVNSMNWTVCLREGNIGVCVWLGAPMMHIMFGLNLVWH